MPISSLLLLVLGCGLLDGPSVLDTPSPETSLAARPPALSLAVRPDLLVAIALPPSNRPEGRRAPQTFTPIDAFRKIESRDTVDVYGVPLPIRSNLIPDRLHGTHTFGSSAPPDLVVEGPDGPMPFERRGRAAGAFGYDRDWLYVGVRPGGRAPDASTVRITFPKATRHEDALNLDSSGQPAEALAFRTLTVDTVSHTGLYLPAPATSRWRVDLPPSAVFTFDATVLTPAIRDAATSDGATVVVEVVSDGATTLVGRSALSVGDWSAHRFDLSPWAGRSVDLVLRTDPGPTATYDYVFLEGPAIYTPSANPRRVVLAFVDTLRADHLGTYGYPRPAAPKIDRWARFGAVFDAARTVAPWTLPSARAVFSGRQPEHWTAGDTLAGRLSAAGYHTEAIVGNAFLSQPFQMERGWTRYTYTHLAPADDVIDRALDALDRHPDRDTAVLVQFMDLHLPYEEPWTYRHLFAGSSPSELESLTRKWLVDIGPDTPGFEAIRDYVVDRYDQNLRFVDDQLPRLLERAGSDATVVLFADHGEEFWDHGAFEHGHAFFDELLRVPLVVRGPGVPAGRVSSPVSLLDVPATVLELEALPPIEDTVGTSLVPLTHGDASAAKRLAERPQAFGRPLYGDDGWAVLTGARKWTDRGGIQSLYDLSLEPGERGDLAPYVDLAPYPGALGEALGRDVVLAWRIEVDERRAPSETTLALHHPSGIRDAWITYDPRGKYATSHLQVEGTRLRLTTPRKEEFPQTIFVLPNGDPTDVEGMTLTLSNDRVDLRASALRLPVRPGAKSPTLLRGAERGWDVRVTLAWVPEPDGSQLPSFSSEVEDQLRELGYLE